MSRHFNKSNPSIHEGQRCNPSKVIKKVFYKDWLRDEDLYCTTYATTSREFYEELRKDIPDLSNREDEDTDEDKDEDMEEY